MKIIYTPTPTLHTAIGLLSLLLALGATYKTRNQINNKKHLALPIGILIALLIFSYRGIIYKLGGEWYLAMEPHSLTVGLALGILGGSLTTLLPATIKNGLQASREGSTLGAGAIAIIGLTGCCSGPVLATVTSIGGVAAASRLSTWSPYLLLSSISLMTFSLMRMEAECTDCKIEKK